MKNKITLILFLVFTSFVFAQQEAMFTHYMFNTLGVNPGYAGSRDALTITGIHRSQWVGFDGAPVTQTLTMHSPIYHEELGAGFSIINDKAGPVSVTSFYGDIAYKMKVSEVSTLSFGLKTGLNFMQTGLTSLNVNDQTDFSFQNNIRSRVLPNFGFGLYYSSPRFYAGISSPRILQNYFDNNKVVGGNKLRSEQRHYFLIIGNVLDLSPEFQLKPTAYLKATFGAPLEADITGTIIYENQFWGGLMFRTGDAFGVLAGINITNQLGIGYSFDWSFGLQTGKYNGGSHEIMLRYDFIFKEEEKIRSPRYF